MIASQPSLLLINPWIYDFAAYDFFARPLGLLYLAGWLRSLGAKIDLLDCLDMPHCHSGPFGTGRYPKEIVPTPAHITDVPRRFGRYGIKEADFRARLARLERPAAVLVTSLMTYWYPGVTAAIRLVKESLSRGAGDPGRDLRQPVSGPRPDHERRRPGAGRPLGNRTASPVGPPGIGPTIRPGPGRLPMTCPIRPLTS